MKNEMVESLLHTDDPEKLKYIIDLPASFADEMDNAPMVGDYVRWNGQMVGLILSEPKDGKFTVCQAFPGGWHGQEPHEHPLWERRVVDECPSCFGTGLVGGFTVRCDCANLLQG